MLSIKALPQFIAWLDGLADDAVRCGLAGVLRAARCAVIVLLIGGSKRTQKTDIKRAKALAAVLD